MTQEQWKRRECIPAEHFDLYKKMSMTRVLDWYAYSRTKYIAYVQEFDSLCTFESAWREYDVSIVSQMHQIEIDACFDKNSHVAEGVVALLIAYYIENGNLDGIDIHQILLSHSQGKIEYAWHEAINLLDDWIDFLKHEQADSIISGACKREIARLVREGIKYDINPKHVIEDTEYNHIARIKLNKDDKPIVLMTQIPELDDKSLYYQQTHQLQYYVTRGQEKFAAWCINNYTADFNYGRIEEYLWGFTAYIFNLEMPLLTYKEDLILGFKDFCDVSFLEEFANRDSQSYENDTTEDSLCLDDINKIDMQCSLSKLQLYRSYLERMLPIYGDFLKHNHSIPFELSEESASLSFFVLAESVMAECSCHSVLWQSLSDQQREVLTDYSKDFLKFAEKELHTDKNISLNILESNQLMIHDLIPNLVEIKKEDNIEKKESIQIIYDKDKTEKEIRQWCTKYRVPEIVVLLFNYVQEGKIKFVGINTAAALNRVLYTYGLRKTDRAVSDAIKNNDIFTKISKLEL